jgi:hypothetical protein
MNLPAAVAAWIAAAIIPQGSFAMAEQSINPFLGTEFEEPWSQGFAAVLLAPDADHSPPSPLTPDAQDAYAKGVTAGEFAAGQLSVPPTAFDEAGDWARVAEVAGHSLLEGAGFFVELFEAKTAGELTLGALGSIALGASLSFTLFLVFSGTLSGQGDFLEDAAAAALRRVRDKLAAAELADNLDLFMAVCDEQSHGLPATDEILKNGFWHGKIFLGFDQAATEARQHEHRSDVRVAHAQTATPDVVEILDVP